MLAVEVVTFNHELLQDLMPQTRGEFGMFVLDLSTASRHVPTDMKESR